MKILPKLLEFFFAETSLPKRPVPGFYKERRSAIKTRIYIDER